MDTTVSPITFDGDEQPDLVVRNIRVGSRIWAASQAFFFVAFFFAFLYLRALNTNGLWRGWPPHHPTPSLAFGVAILLCVLASAAVARATLRLAAARSGAAMWASLGLALAAVGLQAAQFSSLGFGPTDGAYASVFVGWSGLFALSLLGTCYWIGVVAEDAGRADTRPEVRAAEVDGVGFVMLVLAGVEIAAFVLLYIVK
jgi:heme/copper-type cytochrome/quinol oxidase subunit 3